MGAAYGSFVASFLLGVATSLCAAGLILLSEWLVGKTIPKWLMIVAVFMLGLGCGIAAYTMGIDAHYIVPALDNLSLEDAENRLKESHLEPVAIPIDSDRAELGLVTPKSQSVSHGQLVRARTSIVFRVNDQGLSTLEYPRTNREADCVKRAAGFCTIDVEGTDSALVKRRRFRLLLWARSGESLWYLQEPDTVKTSVHRLDGTWKAQAQIGNSRQPPTDGDLVELALTVVAASDPRRDITPTNSLDYTVFQAERVTIRLVDKPGIH